MHPVERRVDLSNIDLDAVAAEIQKRVSDWQAADLTVEPVTWTDNDVDWPTPLRTSRLSVSRPRSVAVTLSRQDKPIGQLIFWAGLGRPGDCRSNWPGSRALHRAIRC